MFEPAEFCRELKQLGVDFYTGVPGATLESLCNYLWQNYPAKGHVSAHNEGGAIGLAAGHFLATGKPALAYMQDSGLGNAIDPILSLADNDAYALPMLILIGMTGDCGKNREPQQARRAEITRDILDNMGVPCAVLPPDMSAASAELRRALSHMETTPGPYALLAGHECFAPSAAVPAGYQTPGLKREEAIKIIMQNIAATTPIIASTGMGMQELYELREAAGQQHERDFLTVGAMGHAPMIALGAALAKPHRHVICLDGDGSLFMHLGSLTLVPSLKADNLTHVLLNNGVHDSAGGQPNLGAQIDLESLAKICGYHKTTRVEEPDELRDAILQSREDAGPWFIEVRVARGFRQNLGRIDTPLTELGQEFREFLCNCGESVRRSV